MRNKKCDKHETNKPCYYCKMQAIQATYDFQKVIPGGNTKEIRHEK